jgi:hypothetical protein
LRCCAAREGALRAPRQTSFGRTPPAVSSQCVGDGGCPRRAGRPAAAGSGGGGARAARPPGRRRSNFSRLKIRSDSSPAGVRGGAPGSSRAGAA